MSGRLLAALALVAIAVGLWGLNESGNGVAVESLQVGTTPARIHRPADARAPGPAVVVAHGFAGSQQLMQPFATTLARAGYTAVTFDFRGHGRNPVPLGGSITEEQGATRVLMQETARVLDAARALGDGRVAILGHSMASDIIVRLALERPEIAATVAVSMFSPVVDAESPENLLVIVGAWEPGLVREALRVTSLVSAPAPVEPGVTYGLFSDGSARRTAVAPRVEHVGVLYSATALREAVSWLDAVFGIERGTEVDPDRRGPFVLLFIAGVLVLSRPLSRLLPVVADRPAGAGLGWGRLWLPLLLPMLATPLLLRPLPTDFLPVLVGDYLAVHFLVYGLLTWACIGLTGRGRRREPTGTSLPALAAAAALVAGYVLLGIVWPVDTWVTSFVPGSGRQPLVAAMLAGTLSFFLAVEWMTRGPGAGRGGYPAALAALVVSLAIAVALDLERLFFLLIIVPVIVLLLVLFGLISSWVNTRTRHPAVGALGNAAVFAWAIAVTFPLLTG